MSSNQIAWGIVKAVVILALLFFIGLPLFGVSLVIALAYIYDHWRDLLAMVVGLAVMFGFMRITLTNQRSLHIFHAGTGRQQIILMVLYLISGVAGMMFTMEILLNVLHGKALNWEILFWSALAMAIGLYLMHRVTKPEMKAMHAADSLGTDFDFSSVTWVPAEKYEALYCDMCTKKIGTYGWKSETHYICTDCHKKTQ